MEIVDLLASYQPLSTTYVGDEDLSFIGYYDKTEEGLSLFDENYLKTPKGKRINNYSSVILTNKIKGNDFLKLNNKLDYNDTNVFTSSLKISDTNLYLTISSNNGYVFTEMDQIFIDSNDRIFELSALDANRMIVKHRKDNISYYLHKTVTDFEFVSDNLSTFNYILDKTNNKLALFYNLSAIGLSSGRLCLYKEPSAFKTNNFEINYYIQELSPRFSSSWVSYENINKNLYEIDPLKSKNYLENNYLITSQYSYISGNEIKANVLTLKNQNTNKNYSYRSDNLIINSDLTPNVDNRNYIGLFTGNEQEKGDYGINLSYEFYNADYKFDSDSYTIFKTPDSLYPYEKINVNDLNWKHIGSISGPNPYVSDKIFRKKIKGNINEGEYLCTWLSKNKSGENVWLDRYYTIIDTTSATTLSTRDPFKVLLQTNLSTQDYYDVYYQFNSYEEEFRNTPQTPESALLGRQVFDKISDMCFVPDEEYIYYHVGNNSVTKYINTLFSHLIQNGLELQNINGTIVQQLSDENTEYVFDGTKFSKIENYLDINDSHQFTISFWLKCDDWSKPFGHQLIGNMNDTGFSVYSDRKVTPFIMVQQKEKAFVYNTDFIQLDIASLEKETENNGNLRIKDIYRTDHLDKFRLITIE